METITYECQLYKGKAQEAAKKKSEFGSSVCKAEREHQEQLVQQTQDDEKRMFYAFIAGMNLQRAQKIAIKNKLF